MRAYRRRASARTTVDLAVIAVPARRRWSTSRASARPRASAALVVISAGFAEIGAEGARAPGRAGRDLPRGRDAAGRPELPRRPQHRAGVRLNATLRARARRRRARRLRLAERRARARDDRPRRATAASGSRRSSRSATRPTSPATTCSSTGSRTPAPTSSCSTSSRSATRAASRGSRGGSAASKPIVAVKSGRSAAGARATARTPARCSRPPTSPSTRFRQAGVIRTDTPRRAVRRRLAARAPAAAARAAGSAIVTNAGGPGILCADACEAAGPRGRRRCRRSVRAALRRVPAGRGRRWPTRST